MMDEREDRIDEFVSRAAREYNAPPDTPRAELWEKIRAERSRPRTAVTPFRRPTVRVLLAIAAILVLGVAIGRFTAPAALVPTASPATLGAAPEKKDRSEVASRLSTAEHLSHIETFLTEFGTESRTSDFSDQARGLLGTTRLMLDSKRIDDPRTRKLLEDLELVLVQIATLNPKDRREDLDFIADGLAQSQLRTRLRNAVPAGPAIRL